MWRDDLKRKHRGDCCLSHPFQQPLKSLVRKGLSITPSWPPRKTSVKARRNHLRGCIRNLDSWPFACAHELFWGLLFPENSYCHVGKLRAAERKKHQSQCCAANSYRHQFPGRGALTSRVGCTAADGSYQPDVLTPGSPLGTHQLSSSPGSVAPRDSGIRVQP